MNPYEVLGAPADADRETLRAFYRQLVRLHHPDRALDEASRRLATERMVAINHAWHIVSDPQRRAAYDARARWQQLDAAREQTRPVPPEEPASPAEVSERELRELEMLEQQLRHRGRRRAARTEREREELDALLKARLREKIEGKRGAPRPRPAPKSGPKNVPSARRQLREAKRLFWDQDRPGEAIALCNNVLRVDNRNVPARELLGDFYLQLGRLDRALPLWEQALALAPDNASIRRKLRGLRPHDARSYKPQPRIPARNTSAVAHFDSHFAPPRPSLWNRARAQLRRYLGR